MDSTEMAFYRSEQIVVNYVVKFHFESTLARFRSGDIFGILTSTQKHVKFLILLSHVKWADSGVPAREFKIEGSNFLESLWM